MIRKTKIVCSLGPASWNKEGIEKLAAAGMNVARLNFSHGSHQQFKEVIARVRKYAPHVAIMLDTKGPEIRTGKVKDDEIFLKTNSKIIVTTETILGTEKKISMNYGKLPKTVGKGDSIMIEDGLLELKVISVKGKEITCVIVVGGVLGNTKNVNLPGKDIDLPAFSQKDIEDIVFGIKQDLDLIAASFVRTAKDIHHIKRLLGKHHASEIKVLAKIEHQQALRHLDEIIEAADGIMVARGDLGVQIPQEEVPLIQKKILQKCKLAAKPCIVATQMLDSMIRNPRPTRAEVTDVANAILDGADAVMLSGETAKGSFPFKSVETMSSIAVKAETLLAEQQHQHHRSVSELHAISKLAVIAGEDLSASAIIVPTLTGYTVKKIAAQRPLLPILAFTPSLKVYRQLQLNFAVIPFQMNFPKNTENLIRQACLLGLKAKNLKNNDLVVITATTHKSMQDETNLLEIRNVNDVVAGNKNHPKLRVKRY